MNNSYVVCDWNYNIILLLISVVRRGFRIPPQFCIVKLLNQNFKFCVWWNHRYTNVIRSLTMSLKTQILTTEYGIMKAVLSQLPSIELNKAATVCKAWNETARIIKKSRLEIYNVSDKHSFEDHSEIERTLHSMKSEPCLCITFLTNQGLNVIPRQFSFSTSQQPSFGRCTEYHILQYLKDNLPNHCLVVGAITPGVVISQNPSSLTAEVENGDAYGLFCIPDFPEVMFKNFYLDRCKMRKVGAVSSAENYSLFTNISNLNLSHRQLLVNLILWDSF